jgi:transcriptional regulator with XRE-family HTH domain
MKLPIGAKVRAARLKRRMSFRAAAAAAAIPASTLQRIEAGSLDVPAARLRNLASALGLRVSELVGEPK